MLVLMMIWGGKYKDGSLLYQLVEGIDHGATELSDEILEKWEILWIGIRNL